MPTHLIPGMEQARIFIYTLCYLIPLVLTYQYSEKGDLLQMSRCIYCLSQMDTVPAFRARCKNGYSFEHSTTRKVVATPKGQLTTDHGHPSIDLLAESSLPAPIQQR